MTSFAKTKKRPKLDEQQQHLLQDRAGSNAMQRGDRLQSALQKHQQLNSSPLERLQKERMHVQGGFCHISGLLEEQNDWVCIRG